MVGDSFTFIDKNSLDDFGIKVVASDSFLPQKRERKIAIPGVSGMYDYGAKNYEERLITIICILTKKLTRAETREIAYWLSRKGRLTLWDEPDKYYIAEIYDSVDIETMPKEVMREFEVKFIAEPFAYKDVGYIDLTGTVTKINYNGTAETPCLLVLKNESPYPIKLSSITATRRRRR